MGAREPTIGIGDRTSVAPSVDDAIDSNHNSSSSSQELPATRKRHFLDAGGVDDPILVSSAESSGDDENAPTPTTAPSGPTTSTNFFCHLRCKRRLRATYDGHCKVSSFVDTCR